MMLKKNLTRGEQLKYTSFIKQNFIGTKSGTLIVYGHLIQYSNIKAKFGLTFKDVFDYISTMYDVCIDPTKI